MSPGSENSRQVVEGVSVPLLLTARRMWLFASDCGTSMHVRNQRLVLRSYRTCGSEVLSVVTELKKASSVVLSTPSFTPVLEKVRTRPLTATRNCDGPTAPSESGGRKLLSVPN